MTYVYGLYITRIIFAIFFCLCVSRITIVYSKFERDRKFVFYGGITPYTSEWRSSFEIKGSKVKVTGNENIEIVFAHNYSVREQESCAIAKTTARCALYK